MLVECAGGGLGLDQKWWTECDLFCFPICRSPEIPRIAEIGETLVIAQKFARVLFECSNSRVVRWSTSLLTDRNLRHPEMAITWSRVAVCCCVTTPESSLAFLVCGFGRLMNNPRVCNGESVYSMRVNRSTCCAE